MADMVNHPPHYTDHPSGVECIEITEHMGFCLGNAMKYIWRADKKGSATQDLEKAVFYINREISLRKKETTPSLTEILDNHMDDLFIHGLPVKREA